MTTGSGTNGAPSADERRRRLMEALRARRLAPGPLAPNQERLFVLQQMDPASTAYAETVVLRLRGHLDTDVLLDALRALPQRHEWLRSRIELGPEGPVQVPDDGLSAVVDRVEFPGSPGGGRDVDESVRTWARSLAETPLSLTEGPLWRAGLARLAEDDHVLVLVVHHVACDAASLAVLLEELADRYDAAVLGSPLELDQPPSARDLARTVRALQTSEPARAAVQVQVDALSGADLGARLEPRGQTSDGRARDGRAAACSRRLPRPVALRTRRLAAEHGVTPFAMISAAIGAVMADAAGADTPVLGMPVDLRVHLEGSEEVVSFLVETVAVVLPDVLGRPLSGAAASVRETVTAALQHPPPFDEVVGALRGRGVLPASGEPLHAYVNWLDGEERTTLGESGPDVSHVDLAVGPPKFDLSWTAVGRDSGDIVLRLEYDSALLGATEAEDLAGDVIRLLEVATRYPDTPLRELELLSDEELTRLRGWEGEAAEVPDGDLFDLVRSAVAAAEGPVVVTPHETVTGDDLLTRVEELAAVLQDAGIGPGQRVAVASRRSAGMVVSVLAVLRAGATFLPVDVSHPVGRQAELIGSAGAVAVVGPQDWAGPTAGASGVRAVPVDASGRPEQAASATARPVQRDASDLAYVMFTSGSTGRPKAVRVPDSAVVARAASYRDLFAAEGVRFLLQSTLAFDASIYLFWALSTGGCLVVPDDEDVADPLALARLMHRGEVTDAFFVPGIYEAVLRVAPPGSLSSCRRLYVGGDVVPPSLAGLHHAVVPQATFFNVYGPTEVVTTSTASPILPADLVDGRPLPIGRPHPGTVARVLDRHGRRVPIGAHGELHLGGPSVADGYDGPGRVADDGGRFAVRKDSDGRLLRWYATGDVVSWRKDGQLDFLGRRDRQVKIRGQRVELGEIEAAARRLPGVGEVAVELLGSGAARRVALFIAPEVDGVRSALAEVLPAAWLPDVVVPRAELPHLPSGKLDRAALREHTPPVAPAQADSTETEQDGGFTELERAVLSVVRTLLDDDRITVGDDFFAVGGNSLLAARLVGQLSSVLGVTVGLHELVGNSTVRGIAALADQDLGRTASASFPAPRLLPVRAEGELAPAVIIARDGATSLVLQHFLARANLRRPLWAVLRPMPPLGFRLPDLVADGVEIARLLEQRFPEGPIHVIGHSASGLVALEAARALGGRRGATVLLDALPLNGWQARQPMRSAVHLVRVAVKRWRLYRKGIRPPAQDEFAAPDVARALRLYQDAVASKRTRMRTISFPVTVLASEESRGDLGRHDIGWAEWAADLRIVPVPGDHVSLLLQPDVLVTAEKIEDALVSWQ